MFSALFAPCASIIRGFRCAKNVQKCAKMCSALWRWKKLEFDHFYRQWILCTFHIAQFHFLHDSKLHHPHRFSGRVWNRQNGRPPRKQSVVSGRLSYRSSKSDILVLNLFPAVEPIASHSPVTWISLTFRTKTFPSLFALYKTSIFSAAIDKAILRFLLTTRNDKRLQAISSKHKN